ncbi:hypothetical protein [Nocardioides houyundeii]|uniref:hypothetical protein n=1 Tax=Nocardioides houyundeii TaxID=2045452 RepID=UPI000C78D554|nr:hypothetical protein [Nocardioides houyundeii]
MGNAELVIEWGNLDRLFQSMQKVDAQSVTISNYFSRQVCSKAGFDYSACALSPIADQLDTLDGYFVDMRKLFQERWDGMVAAIAVTAKDVDSTDGAINFDFQHYLGDMPAPAQVFPPLSVDYESFPLQDPADDLKEPSAGEDRQKHDKDWNAVSSGYDGCRDTINSAIDRINSLGVPGVDLPRLSEKSLQEHIVFPLSGNYRKIQGNAEACGFVEDAMWTWGGNFSALSGKLVAAMRGDVQLALFAHLNLYNVVMKSVGTCVQAGSVVFDGIASMSEKIAVAVEKALVVMGKTLLRVAKKLASRVLGFFGWMMLAKDLVTRGIAAITDIVDDVRACIEIIDACFDLVDSIKAWAAAQAAALDAFKGIVDAVTQLPMATVGGGLGDLGPVDLPTFETKLGEITYNFEGDPVATGGLDDELEDLGEDYPEVPDDGDSGDSGDDDSGDRLMAPGPVGEPSEFSQGVVSA